MRLDDERAALGHGVPGVHGEVHHDLLHLPCVYPHVPERPIGNDRDVHVLADDPAEQSSHIVEQIIEVHNLGRDGRGLAERQKLTSQTSRPGRRRRDLVHVGPQRIALLHIELKQPGAAHDASQQIVEVVSHAARKPAERFEPMCLPHLRFNGNVTLDGDEVDDVAGSVP